jgi:cadherin-like protein/VCBS repeat protein
LGGAASWSKFGANLPDVIVYDLAYDSADNVLVAGTMGRGAWLVNNATANLGIDTDTTAPVFVNDNPLFIQVGATATITSSLLRVDDPDNPHAQLTYTVVTGPSDGTLLKNGVATSSFTQDDIDNNRIAYLETASGVTSDFFTFNVSDPAGNRTGNTPFQFQIFSPHVRPRNDFNADGISDVVLQNTDGTPQIWLMSGTSVASMMSLVNPGPAWHVVATGDFNHDGKADILWQNNDGRPSIWEMNGTSVIFGGFLPANPGPSWHVIATGDFYGDGNATILWQNIDGMPSMWELNGTSIIAGGFLPANPGPSWHAIAAGDVNGDGKADILWQNADGMPAVWEMNGTSVIFGGFLPANPGPAWHAIGLGDFNGDGNADICGRTPMACRRSGNSTATMSSAAGSCPRTRGRRGTRSAPATSTAMARPTLSGRTPTARRRSGR